MNVKYNVTGIRRKELAHLIGSITGADVEYKRAPTFAYEIDFFTLTKEGTLIFSDRSDTEIVEEVLEAVAQAGFECEAPTADTAVGESARELPAERQKSEHGENVGLTVAVPADGFGTDELKNLHNLISAKHTLICKALEIDSTPIEVSEDTVSFPWFTEVPDADSAQAYAHFISSLCQMAKTQIRISPKEKEPENPKYAFRCFLLRLGFIGAEYKAERKILLKNLTGSSAYKNGDSARHVDCE